MRLRYNFLVTYCISLAAGFGNYVLRVILARQLPIDDFGIFYFFISLISIFYFVFNFGIEKTIPKQLSEYRVLSPHLLGSYMLLYATLFFTAISVISLMLLAIQSPLLTVFSITTPAYVDSYPFFIGLCMTWLGFMYFRSVFLGLEKVFYAGIYKGTSYVLTILFFLGLFYIQDSTLTFDLAIRGFFYCHLMVFFIAIAYYFKLSFQQSPISIDTLRSTARDVWSQKKLFYAHWCIVALGSSIPHLDLLFIKQYEAPALLGFYSIAIPLTQVLCHIVIQFRGVFLPRISRTILTQSREQVAHFIKTIYAKYLTLLGSACLFLYLGKRPLLTLFFGPQPDIVFGILNGLIVNTFLYGLAYYSITILIAQNQHEKTAFLFFIAFLSSVGLHLVLDPIYGIWGILISHGFPFAFLAVVATWRVYQNSFKPAT